MMLPIGETRKNKGFTLIEILLVTIVIGIVLAVAVPNFSKGYTRFQLNKTADDLLSISRWAQAMAIGQQRIYALTFADDRRSYTLARKRAESQENGDIEAADDKDTFEPVKGTLGRTRDLPDSVLLDVHDGRIEFYPDGTIDPETIKLNSSGAKLELTSTEVRGMMTKVDND